MRARLVGGQPRRALALLIAATLTVSVLGASPHAGAEDSPDEPSEVEGPGSDSSGAALRFAEGPWLGSLLFTGGLGYGGVVEADGELWGVLELVVVGDTADGTFTLDGSSSAVMEIAGITGTGTGAFYGGGTVLGAASGPVLRRTRGVVHVTAEAGGHTLNETFDASAVPDSVMHIVQADCSMVSGHWGEEEFVQGITGAGLVVRHADGHFVALRQGGLFEADLREVQGRDETERTSDEFPELLREYSELLIDYNAMVGEVWEVLDQDAGAVDSQAFWDIAAAIEDILPRAEQLQAALRNAHPCDEELLGADRLQSFDLMLTTLIRQILELATNTDLFHFDGETLRKLVELGLRTGAIGEGAGDQAAAAETEGLLAERIQEIADQLVDVDGPDCPCLEMTPEAIDLVRAADKLGMTLDIGGDEVAPADLLASWAGQGGSQ